MQIAQSRASAKRQRRARSWVIQLPSRGIKLYKIVQACKTWAYADRHETVIIEHLGGFDTNYDIPTTYGSVFQEL